MFGKQKCFYLLFSVNDSTFVSTTVQYMGKKKNTINIYQIVYYLVHLFLLLFLWEHTFLI